MEKMHYTGSNAYSFVTWMDHLTGEYVPAEVTMGGLRVRVPTNGQSFYVPMNTWMSFDGTLFHLHREEPVDECQSA